jgi:hypothetical protein
MRTSVRRLVGVPLIVAVAGPVTILLLWPSHPDWFVSLVSWGGRVWTCDL